MKLKLDENLGPAAVLVLLEVGHDVATVAEQDLGGAADEQLAAVCRSEDRCLVTLDLDFGNILRFPPSAFPGIAVLRLPEPMSRENLVEACHTLSRALARREIEGKLWVVGRVRVREYFEDEE